MDIKPKAIHNVFISYTGYPTDDFYFDSIKTMQKLLPDAVLISKKKFFWLTQKGFGYGYFNNSGKYRVFIKATFKTKTFADSLLEPLKRYRDLKVFESIEDFKESIKATSVHEKIQAKMNPY
jgi:hypothetical protein